MNKKTEQKYCLAGGFFFLAGVILLMGIMTADSLFPGFSLSFDILVAPGVSEPVSVLVSCSMVVTGLLTLCGAAILIKIWKARLVSICLLLLGIGLVGTGFFNGRSDIYPFFLIFVLLSGVMAMISAWSVEKNPLCFFSLILGVISLVILAGYIVLPYQDPVFFETIRYFGRWIWYPVFLWLLAFGGYLIGLSGSKERIRYEDPRSL